MPSSSVTPEDLVKKYESRFVLPAYDHQRYGVAWLLKNRFGALFDEMGAGKTKQVIDAACVMFEEGAIDRVIVLAPASVRRGWIDPDFGELAKHCWASRFVVYEYHQAGLQRIWENSPNKPRLAFIITNYEFLRKLEREQRVQGLAREKRTYLILDESSAVKCHTSKQSKAVLRIRQRCQRVTLMNGTPMDKPPDLYGQAIIMDKRILGLSSFTQFRKRYMEMKTVKFGDSPSFNAIAGYKNLDELQDKLKPYVLRRLKKDCLDLPEKIYTIKTVPLSPASWKTYKELRDEALSFLSPTEMVMTVQAGVRNVRLHQICSGILGGIQNPDDEHAPVEARIIGTEKVDYLVGLLSAWLQENPCFRLIVWARFRLEQTALLERIGGMAPVYRIYGGQRESERNAAIREFTVGSDKPAVLVGNAKAGGFGLNLTSASTVVYLSNSWSLMERLQSEDRAHRPGQKNKVQYIDLGAVGPQGQATMDLRVARALQNKENVADWTMAKWRHVISD